MASDLRFFVSILLLYLTTINITTAIRNGTPAKPHSHPWMLSLKVLKRKAFINRTADSIGSHMCGASLIRVPYLDDASDVALTAAHCTFGCTWRGNISRFFIVASDHDQTLTDNGETMVGINQSECHPNYTAAFTFPNDIAILKLSHPLNFSKTTQPVELPMTRDETIPFDVQCFIAGWGAIGYDSKKNDTKTQFEKPRYLQEIRINAPTADPACTFGYTGTSSSELTKICNSHSSQSITLRGDSGSPVTCKRTFNGSSSSVLYGIVSHSRRLGRICVGYREVQRRRYFSIYTRVSSFIDWIRDTIDEMHR